MTRVLVFVLFGTLDLIALPWHFIWWVVDTWELAGSVIRQTREPT